MWVIACCSTGAERIVLVRGTDSTPDAAERNYARTVTRHLSRWLSELSLPHDVIGDEDVHAEALSAAQVVILGYNPFPKAGELRTLRAFVKQGGKLVVFYSADTALAELMAMKLGEYKTTSRPGRWSNISFNDSAPPHIPRRILQESHNIRPVYPAGNGSTVIATWKDATGHDTSDPAWVMSRHGFWMTHVLRDDGDTMHKKQMLLALVAACDPAAWRPAATGALENAGRIGSFRSLRQAASAIERNARNAPRENHVRALLARIDNLHNTTRRQLGNRRYPEVVENCAILTDLLLKAHGSTQEAKRGEIRGVWDHTGTGLFPGDWDQTCRLLSKHGITDIFVNMLGDGKAHYRTDVLEESDVFHTHGDQLDRCIAAAKKSGLRVHLWKVCWKLDRARPKLLARMKQEGRLQVSDTGQVVNWLCPTHLDNLVLEKNSIREALRNYPVDGVHLDYIRYPNSHSCYGPTCRKAFEKALGQPVHRWPAAVTSGSLKNRYRTWRSDQITRLVRDVSAFSRQIRPETRISAAVFGKYPLCAKSVGQDWGNWLKDGYVDFVCPMNYTADVDQFKELTISQLKLPAAGNAVLPGIGVTAGESRLDPVQVIEEILVLREAGAAGFVLFDLNKALSTETLPILSLGITADKP